MVKYKYIPEQEVFKRVDNRGPSLKVNIVEARRIESMMQLGIKAPTIMKKIDFTNKIGMTSLRTIMKNIEEGNLDLDGDYPTPVGTMKEMDIEARVSRLEQDVDEFKRRLSCDCSNNHDEGFKSKVRKWMRIR